jgi:flagellar hook protein FlgE
VYDGQGLALTLTYYFQKFDINRWRVFASIEGVPLDQPPGVPYDPTIHDPRPLLLLDFGPDGRLSPASRNEGVVAVKDPRRLAPALLFPALPVRALEMTQFGAPFRVWRLEQDGYAWGQLTGLHFGADGVVSLSYSSGQMRKAYQLELAEFSNPGGLTPVGKHFWAASSSSGRRITSAPASGSAGSILAGALEEDFVPGR